jgi:hypothetical protein
VKVIIFGMSKYILDQVDIEMKGSSCFALQLDESTDVASCEELLVCSRYMKELNEGEISVLLIGDCFLRKCVQNTAELLRR